MTSTSQSFSTNPHTFNPDDCATSSFFSSEPSVVLGFIEQFRCKELRNMVETMDRWQRQNMVGAFATWNPHSEHGGRNFDAYLLHIDRNLTVPTLRGSPTYDLDEPRGAGHEGYILPGEPANMRGYRAYQRKGLQAELKKDQHVARPIIKDLGESGKEKPKPGQGLEMDAYRRLFWVLGFWWCPKIDKFEDSKAVKIALNAMQIGGNAVE